MSGIFFSGGRPRFDTGQTDGQRRLADAIGQLIQVNQLCVLLGSGASSHLGSPRIRTMTGDEVAEICAQAASPLSEDARDLLDHLITDVTDLEFLMGRLTAALAYAEAFGVSEVDVIGAKAPVTTISELFGSVNVGIAAACQLPSASASLEPPFDMDPWHAHREFFRRLLSSRRPDAPRVKVFTTNYDTVVEQSLDASGIHYFDGFIGGVRRSLDLSSYSNDLFARSAVGRGLLPVHDLLHLYKLHGSLTWRVTTSAEGLGNLRIVQAVSAPRKGEFALIYPTPTKEADVVGHPYADLLREFSASLSTPECALLVAGYGFADEHVNRIIYQALSFNSTLQVLVADPRGVVADSAPFSETIERLDSPLGRLSAVEDARISVLTGNDAAFVQLATTLPDVSGVTLEHREALDEALAQALSTHRSEDHDR